MKINRDNYELFFINYLDGQLSDVEVEEVKAFLIINPDLQEELEEMKSFTLSAETEKISFPQKNKLKKSVSEKAFINDKNIDEFLIAYMEKDLTSEEEERVESFLKHNPAYLKDFELYKKTYLKPEKHISFPDKGKLKKAVSGKVVRLKQLYTALAVAASLTIMFVLFNTINVGSHDMEGLKLTKTHESASHILEDLPIIASLPEKVKEKPIDTKPYTSVASTFISSEEKPDKERIHMQRLPFNKAAQIDMHAPRYMAYEERNELSSIYHYIKLAAFNEVAEDYSDIMPEQPRQSFLAYTAQKIFTPRDITGEDEEAEPRFGFREAIDISTYGINSLANRELININSYEADGFTRTELALRGNVIYSRSRVSE